MGRIAKGREGNQLFEECQRLLQEATQSKSPALEPRVATVAVPGEAMGWMHNLRLPDYGYEIRCYIFEGQRHRDHFLIEGNGRMLCVWKMRNTLNGETAGPDSIEVRELLRELSKISL